jgi:hypothetical protein
MNSTSIMSVVGWGAPAAGEAREAHLGLGDRLGCQKGVAPLCGLLAGSVLAGLLLQAARGAMIMALQLALRVIAKCRHYADTIRR